VNAKSPDVIVVGGGIVGTSTAYYLASKGIKVMLLEAGDIAGGTSGACDRAIMIQSKNPGPLLNMALSSAAIYQRLEEELGEMLEYNKKGGMIVIERAEELGVLETIVRRQREAGIDVKLIGREEALARQPALSPHITGATWWDGDADVNPMSVCLALARGAKARGAEIVLRTRVNGLILEKNRVVGVSTPSGVVRAEKTVLAAGVWTPQLGRSAGVNIPIIPRKGQILVSEKIPPLIIGNILSGSYIACKHNPRLAEKAGEKERKLGLGLSLGQTKNGNLLIGGTREFAGYDRSTCSEAIRAVAANAARLFPALKNVRIIRSFAGLRPYTPDGLPLLGQVAERPGLYLAAGHEGDGVALGPVTGNIMADVIADNKVGWDLTPFTPERFEDFYRS
jgi:sarcosine oxidase subunit beta